VAKFLDTESFEHDIDPTTIVRHAERLGEHNEAIDGLKSWQEEAKDKLTDLDGKVSGALDQIANRPATVPDEVWNRIGALETRLSETEHTVEEAVEEAEEETLGDPIPIEPPTKTEKEPDSASGTKTSLFHRVARAFR
jgi:hypothetical protein